ncbi:stalk domain-containing protein [Thermobacillus sp. ZCTH02-B1]|uniref:stalk domain-containing protein n=1 Tax=Thermobacillus sp. ZCTH02-B1 TaxID=1858795 RepID=UPI0025E855F4|nr:stalk domain-containing protein [Thermobacillus sp. ZCTH02-B1]
MAATLAGIRRGIAICVAAVLVAWPLAGEWTRTAHAAAGSAAPAAQQDGIRVMLDGKPLSFTPAPIREKGVTLVPMRPIFTAFGAKVTWVSETRTVFAVKGILSVSLQADARQAVVNGEKVALDVPARLIDNTMMVPLRFVASAFGAKVRWEAGTQTVFIETAESLEREREAAEAGGRLTPAQIVELNDDRVVMITTDTGQGSGVIVGSRWVLTNWHVIDGSDSGHVILNDGTSVGIQGVAAADEDADLAVVQTTRPLGIAPVVFADPDSVRKGDRIVAISSPLGYRNTVSEGLISNFIESGGITYYQINAPIDRGSSGGAVFNEYGELVGITTAVIRDTLASLNFAVPAYYAEPLLGELAANPPAASSVRFPGRKLPDSLAGASNEEIRELLEAKFGGVQTTKGLATFTDWTVTRDGEGWLVMTAVINPSFYMLYAEDASGELRWWAINLATEMRRMLPDVNLELIVYYSRTFNAKPRGFAPDDVTYLGDGEWRVQYEVLHLQYMDKIHLSDIL